MTEKQRRFVEFYLGEAVGNATLAAKMAGYSESTASVQALKLMKKSHVQKALSQARQPREEKAIATRRELRERLTKMIRGTAPMPMSDGSLQEMPVAPAVQIDAMALYSKITGMQAPKKLELTGKNGGPVQVAPQRVNYDLATDAELDILEQARVIIAELATRTERLALPAPQHDSQRDSD